MTHAADFLALSELLTAGHPADDHRQHSHRGRGVRLHRHDRGHHRPLPHDGGGLAVGQPPRAATFSPASALAQREQIEEFQTLPLARALPV